MKSIIIKNLSFSYNDSLILNKININIEYGKSVSIIGTKGKTTLLRLLEFKLKGMGNIIINGIEMNNDNFRMLSKYYTIVYKEETFKEKFVKNEIIKSLEINNSSIEEKNDLLIECIDYFNLRDLLSLEVGRLSRVEKYLISVICSLLKNPMFMALDDILCEFDNKLVDKIFNWCDRHHITIINVTSEMETVMKTQYLYCLYDGKIILEGCVPDVFKEEKIIRRLGYKLPFLIDMSIQLNCYDLIKGFYLSKEELVKEIWK